MHSTVEIKDKTDSFSFAQNYIQLFISILSAWQIEITSNLILSISINNSIYIIERLYSSSRLFNIVLRAKQNKEQDAETKAIKRFVFFFLL